MSLDGVETLVIQHRLEQAVGCRIAVESGHGVGTKRAPDRGSVFERPRKGLADQLGRQVGVIKALRDTLHDSPFQGVMMQNGRIDERCQLGLFPHYLLGFPSNPVPHRVYLLEGIGRPYLLPSHYDLPPFCSSIAHLAMNKHIGTMGHRARSACCPSRLIAGAGAMLSLRIS